MPPRYWLKRALVFCMKRQPPGPWRRALHGLVLRHDGTRVRLVGAGHRLEADGAALEGVDIAMVGEGHTVRIAPGAILTGCRVRMAGAGHTLEIGANCHLMNVVFAFEDAHCRITLGAGTTIESGHIAAVEPGSTVTIGADCMLADGIDLRTSDSHAVLDAASGERLNPPGHVRLGDHVWLGAHAAVLKGVTIGDHAVIGARAVVTRDVPAGCVAAGAPARVLREGVTWRRAREAP